MKTLKKTLFVFYVLILSVITFFSFNLVTSLISNYQALSPTTISFVPMFMFMLICIIFIFGIFNFSVYKRKDAYFVRNFSIPIGIISIIGIVFSILCGTYVYHNFFGDYVFLAYPFVMLLAHLIFLVLSVGYGYISLKEIVINHPEKTFKAPKLFWLRELVLGLILTYALEKLGAFLLIPLYYSGVDSIYVLPFLVQLLIPVFVFAIFMIQEYWLHNRKLSIILSSVAFGYSLFSCIFMIVISKESYPLTITPLSPIMQLERLVTKPYDFIALYGISFLLSGFTLVSNLIPVLKKK